MSSLLKILSYNIQVQDMAQFQVLQELESNVLSVVITQSTPDIANYLILLPKDDSTVANL
jgi:hypothetical protein